MTAIREDRATAAVEQQTARLPSMTWLGLAVGSMIASAALFFSGRKELGNFVGQWAPSFLIIGVYNKVAKESSQTHAGFGYRSSEFAGAEAH